MKKTKGGIPTKVVREIKSLESVDSPHVLRLFEYFPFGSCIVLILDFMVTDLHQVCYSVYCTACSLVSACDSVCAHSLQAGVPSGYISLTFTYLMHPFSLCRYYVHPCVDHSRWV